MKKLACLNANTLKIIAAITMVIDHIGVLIFPYSILLRLIGRLSLPIFAFMISEGARYTKNKLRYFLTIFALSVLCQIVYFVFDESLYMCILVTFSISILLIYLLNYVKRLFFEEGTKWYLKYGMLLLFILSVCAVAFITSEPFINKTGIQIDYGFFGIMTPVLASLFDFRGINVPEKLKKLDNIPVRVLCSAVGLFLLATFSNFLGIQYYSLLSVPLLLLYSGERGKLKMKYFFYIFYPLHLAVIAGIGMLIYMF